MPLNIKDQRAHDLARRLADLTGESLTDAVRTALQERLKREEARHGSARSLKERLTEIAEHCASLPAKRNRSEDDILGYDERGLPSQW